MISHSDSRDNERWTKANHLLIDLSSMEEGFVQKERDQQEIWDYVCYRESLVKWPSVNEKIRMGMNLNPVVALNSALRFIKPLPRGGWLSNQCRHLDQSKSDLWKLSSKR